MTLVVAFLKICIMFYVLVKHIMYIYAHQEISQDYLGYRNFFQDSKASRNINSQKCVLVFKQLCEQQVELSLPPPKVNNEKYKKIQQKL